MIDTTSATPTASATATVCEGMALFGTAPERGELDSRDVWDEDDATDALSEAIRVIVDGITVDGTQMADEREPLMWGLTNMLATSSSTSCRTLVPPYLIGPASPRPTLAATMVIGQLR